MNLLDVYSMYQSKQLSHDETAKAFGITSKDLKFRLTRWGHRLPLLLATLDKIARNDIGRAEAAEVLQVGPRAVNQLMKTWKIERDLRPYLIERTASKVKWEVHKKFAIEFIAARLDLEKAAAAACCSTRQMRRIVSQLLEKHFDMTFKEMTPLSMTRRQRLANEIEVSEGLEEAKKRAADAISNGHKTLADEAVERLLARRKRIKRC